MLHFNIRKTFQNGGNLKKKNDIIQKNVQRYQDHYLVCQMCISSTYTSSVTLESNYKMNITRNSKIELDKLHDSLEEIHSNGF